MGHVAFPERSLDRPECCRTPQRCPSTAVRPLTVSFVSACDAVTVSCRLESGHDGPHMSEPVRCRSLLGRRRWLVTHW